MKEVYTPKPSAERVTPAVSVYLAELVKISNLEVVGAQEQSMPPGQTLLVRASPNMLHLSRRQGGLRHRFGVIEADGAVFGTLYVHGEDELQLILLDLSDPEVRGFVFEAAQSGGLKVLMADESRNMRLMVTGGTKDFQLLSDAAKGGRIIDASDFAMQLGEAMRFATSRHTLQQLGVNRKRLAEIQVSCVVTPLRAAEVERAVLGGLTH